MGSERCHYGVRVPDSERTFEERCILREGHGGGHEFHDAAERRFERAGLSRTGTRRRELPTGDHLISDRDRARAAGVLFDLGPCPLCGGDPLSVAERNAETGNVVAKVFCPKCVLVLSVCERPEREAEARAEAEARWNRRPTPGTCPAPAARLEVRRLRRVAGRLLDGIADGRVRTAVVEAKAALSAPPPDLGPLRELVAAGWPMVWSDPPTHAEMQRLIDARRAVLNAFPFLGEADTKGAPP